MNKKELQDIVITGFALFAMFFGAGNLIFPPALGLAAGTGWFPVLVGFLITGAMLPVLGTFAISKAGGTIYDIAGKVNLNFAKVFGLIIILAIAFLIIPRTCATVFETGVLTFFPDTPALLFSAVYFALVLVFIYNPSGIVDKIGKFMTPILLVLITIIIVKGVLFPVAEPIDTGATDLFVTGFTSGYQTMDALGAIIYGGLISMALKSKGYTGKKQMVMTMKAGLIAGAGLLFVYGGLLYLGSNASGMYSPDIARTTLVVSITEDVVGVVGKALFAALVAVACFSTAAGVTATIGEFFEHLTNGKLSYKKSIVIVCLASTFIAIYPVAVIIKIAVPLLVLLYPVAMVLIIMNLLDDFIPKKKAYLGGVTGAIIIGGFEAAGAMGIDVSFATDYISMLPFASVGFAWVLPALVCAFVAPLIIKEDAQETTTSIEDAKA